MMNFRRRHVGVTVVTATVVVVTFTAAVSLLLFAGLRRNSGAFSSLGNSTSLASWRRKSSDEKIIYQTLIQEKAKLISFHDRKQHRYHIEISPSQQDGLLAVSLFQQQEKISRPVFSYSLKRRRLNDRDEGTDSLHDDIDCDDPMYAFEGDELEACKEQQATSPPSEYNTDGYETLFPVFGDAEDGGGVATDPTFADESTGNPQDMTETRVPAPPDTPPEKTTPPPIDLANGIRLTLSMGIIHLEDLTSDETDTIVTMCLRTITIILNRYSPIYVRDYLGHPQSRDSDDDDEDDDEDNGRRNRQWRSSSRDGIRGSRSSSRRSHDGNVFHRKLRTSFRKHHRQLGSGNHNSNRPPPLAKLYLNDVHIHGSAHMKHWFVIHADYAAYWTSNGRPVLSVAPLYEIDLTCHAVLDMSMTRTDFWDTLTGLSFGQDLVLRKPTMQDRYEPDEHGLADCETPGYEYDLSPYLIIRPNEQGSATAPGMVQDGNASATFPHVIATTATEIVWLTREWIGLGLLVATAVFVILLSAIAMYLEEKRMRQQFWGANLTEQGVNELLNVGWRYTQGDAAAAAVAATGEAATDGNGPTISTYESSPQLFLQVFDKGRIGYNDDNSLLQGGVERDHVHGGADAIEQTSGDSPTATQTTSTPS